jgi:hypothetical protein
VPVPALFIAVLILARVGVGVGVRVRVRVRIRVRVRVRVGVRVTVIAVAVTIAVAIRVTVLIVTVAGLAAARPILAPFVAVALNASRNRHTALFRVDLVHASVEHPRSEVPTPVLTGGRLLAVLLETDSQHFSGLHIAFVQSTAGLDTVIAELGGDGFAFLITGGRLWVFAVLRDAILQRFSGDRGTSLVLATVATRSTFTSGSGLRLDNHAAAAGAAGAVFDASVVDLPSMALTPVFAGGRLGPRALPGTLEKAVDRAPKALFAVVAVRGAPVEHGKRLRDATITTLTGR